MAATVRDANVGLGEAERPGRCAGSARRCAGPARPASPRRPRATRPRGRPRRSRRTGRGSGARGASRTTTRSPRTAPRAPGRSWAGCCRPRASRAGGRRRAADDARQGHDFSMKSDCSRLLEHRSPSRPERAPTPRPGSRRAAPPRPLAPATIVFSSRSTRRFSQAGPAARLRRAEHVALAALLEVDAAQLEAVGGGGDRVEPLARRRLEGRPTRDQQAEAGDARHGRPGRAAGGAGRRRTGRRRGAPSRSRWATSTPTSITVVATSTSISPAAKARIVASFSSGGILPWSLATRSPASGPSASSTTTSSTRGQRRRSRAATRLPSSSRSSWSASPCSSSSPLIRGQTT